MLATLAPALFECSQESLPLRDWPSGNGNRQHEEPYSVLGAIDDYDGRNVADMAYVFANSYASPFTSQTQLENNCGAILNP
jgi:hypothetical protein